MSERLFEGVVHAALYAKFRPGPPLSLIARVINFLKEKYVGELSSAIDIGCGPGTSTYVLEPYFSNITGLDVSPAQIDEANKNNTVKNITFKVSPAEELPFKDESVHLVTAGQCCHWFDMPKFFKEVDRILVPNGVLAIYGYQFPLPLYKGQDIGLYKAIEKVRMVDTKEFWGSRRLLLEDSYKDPTFKIPYPDPSPRDSDFWTEVTASVSDLRGYLLSWSAVQKYNAVHGEEATNKLSDDFVESIMDIINDSSKMPDDTFVTLRFPFFLLLGRKPAV